MDVSRRKALLGLGAASVAGVGVGVGLTRNSNSPSVLSSSAESTKAQPATSNTATSRSGTTVAAPTERPNIIVFVSDDQAYDTVGQRTDLYQSPNADELAGQGYLLDRSYVTTSICPVSRANILTGQFAERHRQLGWHWPINDDSFSTIYPFELKRAGYQIGFVGKWGVSNPLPREEFDYVDGFEDQGQYFDSASDRSHLTADLTDSAMAAIDQFSKSEKPYLLVVCYKAPHGQQGVAFPKTIDTTIDYPEFDLSIHADYPATLGDLANLPTFIEESIAGTGVKSALSPLETYQEYRYAYAQLLYGVDISIGKIVDHATATTDLDELEILSLSDNGMMLGDHGIFGKWLMYEQSVAIPFVWKPSIYSDHSEAINKSFCLTIDVAPTVLRAAQIEIPATYQGIPLQDLSAEARSEYYYSYYVSMDDRLPVCHGVQDHQYKYIEFDHHDYQQMFDTVSDPDEVINLVSDPRHATRLKTMQASLVRHREAAGPHFDKA